MPLKINTKNCLESSLIYQINTQADIDKTESRDAHVIENNNTNPNILFIAKRVMEHLSQHSYERRSFSQTCRALRDFDKEHFVYLQQQINIGEQKGVWLSLNQYYARLLPCDLGGTQNVTDNSILTIDRVRRKYDKIRERQAFEINHFLKGFYWYPEYDISPKEFKDELFEKVTKMESSQEHNLMELERTHNFLNRINYHIIQEIIDRALVSDELFISKSYLTRFPSSVIEDNLLFFQAIKSIAFYYGHLQTLPETIGHCQKLRWLHFNNNDIETLPESIGQLRALEVLDCRNNKLQALAEGLERFTLGPQNTRESAQLQGNASNRRSSGPFGQSIVHSYSSTLNRELSIDAVQELSDARADYEDLDDQNSNRFA